MGGYLNIIVEVLFRSNNGEASKSSKTQYLMK